MLVNKESYQLGVNPKRDFRLFFLCFCLFDFYGLFFEALEGINLVGSYATTLLAFSYFTTGFGRRALVGTIFDILCRIFPGLYSPAGAVGFIWGMNILYYASILLFVKYALSKIEDQKIYSCAYFFALIAFTFLIPSTCYYDGAMGKVDFFQMALGLFQIYLLMEQKFEWITVPITVINTLFHEGYVLMTFCAVLIVILFRAVNSQNEKGKYWAIFALNIAACGITAALSLLATKAGTVENFNAAYGKAELLHPYGWVHNNLLTMMAGYSPSPEFNTDDGIIVARNLKELPLFLALFIPAFLVFGRGLLNLIKFSDKKSLVLHIVAIFLGPILVGVEYIKYCDYGRYLLWLVFYYFVVFLAFAAMGDEAVKRALGKAYNFRLREAILIVFLFLLYEPLPCCGFTHPSELLAQMLFGH